MKRSFVGLGLVVLIAAGCGAVEHEPDLAAAVEATQARESWRFEFQGTEPENRKLVQIRCTGGVDHARKRVELSCDHTGGAFGLRVVDGVVYAKEGTGRDAKWQRSRGGVDEGLDDLSPDRLLSILRSASVASEHLGEEAVRGVSTARHRLTVDCKKAEFRDCRDETVPAEAWIAEDDTVRRIQVAAGDYSATMEFFDFGAEVDIQPPPADEVQTSGDPDEPQRCDPDGGTPIQANQAIDALRRNSFSVTSRDTCFRGLAAALDNTGVPRVLEREGIVMCHVYDRPQGSATDKVVRRGVDGGDAELVLANLECMIFTDRPDPEPSIDRLEKAFAELER